MEENRSFYNRCIICLSFILLMIFGAFSASGEEDDPITWITSRQEAIEIALNDGKYILLIIGSEDCPHCTELRETVCETTNPPIKQVIMDNYVPWFCDVDSWWEYYGYINPYPPVPFVFRIDPRNPQEYIDSGLGVPSLEIFYNFLLNGLGDLDSDGMPDEWERQHGLDALSDDADEDPDGDNFSNLDEYLNETDPNDAESHPTRFMPWLPLLLEED